MGARTGSLGACAAALAVVVVGGGAAPARAGSCGDDAAVRAAAIRTHLAHEAHRARVWDVAWAVGFGGAAVAQAGMAAARWEPPRTVDDAVVAGLWLGAGKAALAAGSHAVLRLRIPQPGPSTDDACADLDAAERALEVAARHERRTFWLGVTGSVVFNAGGLIALGTEWHSWREGLLSAAVGVPVGLVNAWTQPRASWRAWRRGALPDDVEAPVAWRLEPLWVPHATGIAVRGAF